MQAQPRAVKMSLCCLRWEAGSCTAGACGLSRAKAQGIGGSGTLSLCLQHPVRGGAAQTLSRTSALARSHPGHPRVQESGPASARPLLPLLGVQELTGKRLQAGTAPPAGSTAKALSVRLALLWVFAKGWWAVIEGSEERVLGLSFPSTSV